MESWNQRYISAPPNRTVKYSRKNLKEIENEVKKQSMDSDGDPHSGSCLSTLKSILERGNSQITATNKNFKYEISYLQAFIYQNGNLRKEKFMQAIKKVNKCLKRWNEVEISDTLNNVLQMMPEELFYEKSVWLPSSPCIYYLLQRLVASFHLLLKCVSYCLEAAIYLRAKIVHGHFVGIASLGYATCARIRALALDLVGSLASTNDQLHPFAMAMIRIHTMDSVEDLPRNLESELKRFVASSSSAKKVDRRNRRKLMNNPYHMDKKNEKYFAIGSLMAESDEDDAEKEERKKESVASKDKLGESVSAEDDLGESAAFKDKLGLNSGDLDFQLILPSLEEEGEDLGECVSLSGGSMPQEGKERNAGEGRGRERKKKKRKRKPTDQFAEGRHKKKRKS